MPNNGTGSATGPSDFAQRLAAAVDQWARWLPESRQREFRDTFRVFADDHERALAVIGSLWERRERATALDECTGLARRRPFQEHLIALLRGLDAASCGAIGVLFLDLNGLKRINDTCGHEAGDRAVAAAGRIIREAIRVERDVDFVAPRNAGDEHAASRHGGDEFLIAVELTTTSEIDRVALRVRHRVDDPVRQQAHGYYAHQPFTVAVGGVVFERPESPSALPASVLAQHLIAAADQQMYASKRDGRIHIAVACFTDEFRIDPIRSHVLHVS